MRSVNQRLDLLNFLGELFRDISSDSPSKFQRQARQLKENLAQITKANPWFTPESVSYQLSYWGKNLEPGKVNNWVASYSLNRETSKPGSILTIMAGNIPLVGFHDFVSVILSGHKFAGKLSSRDKILFPIILQWILEYDSHWNNYINLSSTAITAPDAIIATGSNNTSGLIKQKYAGKPKIIRHNRNSIGLLTGEESAGDLGKLAKDILLYYGLGCRNISLLFVPLNYDFNQLAKIIKEYAIDLPAPYINNLKYQKALASMNEYQYIDAGKMILYNNPETNSPLAAINYTSYSSKTEIDHYLTINRDNIQCIVGDEENWEEVIPFGTSQYPKLNDYADGIDTLEFLTELKW